MTLHAAVEEFGSKAIPLGWRVYRLGDHAQFRTGPFGSALHKSDYVEDGWPVINPMQIVDGDLIPTSSMTITEASARRLSDFRLVPNDIVIGRRGEMGRCAVVQPHHEGWLCGTGSMIIRASTKLNPSYLQRVLASAETVAAIENASVGTTMINLNQGTLANLALLLPPRAEQDAIATALSDADALIDGLESLIVKKRAIKRGAMQELLEPQSTWIERRLGTSAQLKARIGWQGLTTAEYLDSGTYHLVTGTDFKGGFIDWNECHFVEKHRYDQDKYIQLRENDVLVTKDGTIGKIAFIDRLPKPATLNSGVFVIRPLANAFRPMFFYYLLMSPVFGKFLARLSAGSTINHLYQKDFVGFTFQVPPTSDEQDEIARTLLDMDHEIQGLEARLAKVRQLNQGMRQELLTGRVRLA